MVNLNIRNVVPNKSCQLRTINLTIDMVLLAVCLERYRFLLFLLFGTAFVFLMIYTSHQLDPNNLGSYGNRGSLETSTGILMRPYALHDDSAAIPKDFEVISEICPESGKYLQLLIVVMSSPSNFEERMAIRRTWGHFAIRQDVALIFILGTTKNSTLNFQIEVEKIIYLDIISYDFIDSIEATIFKSVSMLYLVANYCFKTAFVLKTKDDMFINVNRLLYFLNETNPDENKIYGRIEQNWKPTENYFVLPKYPIRSYPDFTSGAAYTFPARLASSLHGAGRQYAYANYEDVLVTGFAADKLGIFRVNVPIILKDHVVLDVCGVQKIISVRTIHLQEQYDFWIKMLSGGVDCK